MPKKSEGKWVVTEEGIRYAPRIYREKGSMTLKERIETAMNMIDDLEKGLIGETKDSRLEAIRDYLHTIYRVLKFGVIS